MAYAHASTIANGTNRLRIGVSAKSISNAPPSAMPSASSGARRRHSSALAYSNATATFATTRPLPLRPHEHLDHRGDGERARRRAASTLAGRAHARERRARGDGASRAARGRDGVVAGRYRATRAETKIKGSGPFRFGGLIAAGDGAAVEGEGGANGVAAGPAGDRR